ncbi:MAG: S8 family serine peptidase [Candidatus Asgardarchaeia archaeon]
MEKRNFLIVVIAFLLTISLLNLPNYSYGSYEEKVYNKKLDSYLLSIIPKVQDDERLDVLVKINGDKIAFLEDLLKNYDVELRYVYSFVNYVSISARVLDILRLSSQKYVDFIYYDREVKIQPLPIDSPSSKQYVYNDHFIYDVNGKSLWDLGYNGSGTIIAVLDTGIDTSHPDLDDMDDNPNTSGEDDLKVIAFIDLVNGRDDLNATDGIDGYDDNGHGTAVASIIAGTGEASGGKYKGMAPGAKLIGIKIMDSSGDGKSSDVIAGIEKAIELGADIISMSLGTEVVEEDPMIEAVNTASSMGYIIVVAAGNEGPELGTINSPGAAISAITVGSSYNNVCVAAWSSVGPAPLSRIPKPDLVAPGFNLVAAKSKDAWGYFTLEDSEYYILFSGTSASAPIVSGSLALLKEAIPDITPLKAKIALMKTARDLGESFIHQGAGLLDLKGAYELLNSSTKLDLLFPKLLNEKLIMPSFLEVSNLLYLTTSTPTSLGVSINGNVSMIVENVFITSNGTGYYVINTIYSEYTLLNVSNTGVYTGDITLRIGLEEREVSVKLELSKYRGKVLADLYHQAFDDYDSPESYQYIWKLFVESGFSFEESKEPLSLSVLERADVLLIFDSELDFSTIELNSILEWVKRGGILLLAAEAYDPDNGVAYYNIESYDALLEPTGFKSSKHIIGNLTGEGASYGVLNGCTINPSPITNNVDSLYITWGTTLIKYSENPNSEVLFSINSTDAFIVISNYGYGSIIAFGDTSFLLDDSIIEASYREDENVIFLRNLVEYIKVSRPVVYYLNVFRVSRGEYVIILQSFDDKDIPRVYLALFLEGKTWENKTLTPEYGYVYITILRSNNVINAFIVIEDSEGRIRVLDITEIVREENFVDVYFLIILLSLIISLFVILSMLRRKRRREIEGDYYIFPNDYSY